MDVTKPDSEREQTLDALIQALGNFFSSEICRIDPVIALATCSAIEQKAARVRFEIELAPLRLVCSIVRDDQEVVIASVVDGFETFKFLPRVPSEETKN